MREFVNKLIDDLGVYEVDAEHSNTDHEIGSVIRKSCDQNGPAILFHTPNSLAKRVIGGLFASPRNVKRILSTNGRISDFEAVKHYSSVSSVKSSDNIANNIILRQQNSCQEVVFTGKDVDLHKLPICVHNEHDVGKFITAGVNVVKWIDGITHGLGIHRMKVIDRNHLSCLAPPNRRIGFPYYKASEQCESIDMSVIIGGPPSVILASQAKIPFDCEKYIVASRIEGDKLPVTRCITNDLLVPVNAEMIIECKSVPNKSHNDTPFAEYPGTYSYRTNAWVTKVTAITMRHDCIYHTILTGRVPQEDSNLCAIPMAAEIYKTASSLVEKVTDISVFLGNNVFDTVICIKKNSNEEVQNLIWTILGNKYIKSVTIMNDDLKATEKDWRFAFNTRYQPNRDTTITGLGLGASLDPSSPLFQSTSKIGLDFTYPIGKTDDETEFSRKRHKIADVKIKNIKDYIFTLVANRL